MARVLITGGAGFIGSHLAEAFLAEGWEVAVLDNLATGRRENVPPAAGFFEADITDRAAVDRVLAEVRPEVVEHHAAQTSVRRASVDPAFDLGVNVLGSLLLLEAAARAGASRFVFASSGGALYGDEAPLPTPETAPCSPASPYGVSKLAAEQYLWYAGRAHGLACCALRYANVYGPRQDPFGEAGVVAIFAARMLAGGETRVNGDGLQTRDYVFVEDVVAANLAAVRGGVTGAFNVGCGIETDVVTLHETLARLTGSARPRVHGPPMPGEQRRSCLDAARLRDATGWRPAFDLAAGLARTVAWLRAAGGEGRA